MTFFNYLILSVLVMVGCVGAVPHEKRDGTKYFFSFGDSYSQTGFDISGTKPSASNPFGNPAYPGWTTDNGANWIGVLIHDLAPSGTLSYNFASGGSTVDASIVKLSESDAKDLVHQTAEWHDNLAAKPSYAPWTGDSACFAIWIGENDIGNSYGSGGDQESIHNSILDQYFKQVQIMYDAGGRNFLFLTVAPMDKTPSTLSQGGSASSQEATQIAAFNTLLNSRATSWAASASGAKAQVYDAHGAFMTAIADPTKYGAKDAMCYNKDGTTCLWWNDYHPGQAIQKLVGQGAYSTLQGGGFF